VTEWLDLKHDLGDPENVRAIVAAVAWGLMPVPERDRSFHGKPSNIHRTVVLKACQIYAFSHGFNFTVRGLTNGGSLYSITNGNNWLHDSTIQQCMQFLLECTD
jgi:hypothetical protein